VTAVQKPKAGGVVGERAASRPVGGHGGHQQVAQAAGRRENHDSRAFQGAVAVRHRAGAAKAAPSRARRTRLRHSTQWAAWGFIAPVVGYLAVFYAYPLYRNIDLSIRSYTVASFITATLRYAGFANYSDIIHNSTFAPALINTAIFVFVSIALQFTIGLALAVFFFRKFPLSGSLRALFLIPWLLPLLVSRLDLASWMLNSDSGIVNALLNV